MQRGFSLLELLMVTAIIGSIVVSLAVTVDRVGSSSVALTQRETTATDAAVVLNEIESAVRASEGTLGVGSNLLKLQTRFFVDQDEDVETVGYFLENDELVRVIHDPVTGESSEILLRGVVAFECSYYRIEDDFSAERYDGATFSTGTPTIFDTLEASELSVSELDVVDPDLLACYRASDEDLEIECSDPVQAMTVTVTPLLPADALRAAVTFSPDKESEEYRPLVFGEAVPDTTNASILFAADGSVRLRVAAGGLLTGEVVASDLTWVRGARYHLQLELSEGRATAYLRRGDSKIRIGTVVDGISAASTGRVHFQACSDGARGIWDEFEVERAAVDLSLTVKTSGTNIQLFGAAVRRQP